jgi:ketosteroid isomerase-like protein
MSQENVEIVRAAHPPSGTELTRLFADDSEALSRMQAVAPMFHPEFEFSTPTFGGVGFRVTGKGLPELVEAWRDWMEPWEVYWTEVEDFIEAADDQVVVKLRDHGRLQGSEAEVEQLVASVWTLRDRKVARIDFYPTQDQALEAAGLRE